MSFDWQYYLDTYPDLRNAGIVTEEHALNHWNIHGKREGRESFGKKCGIAISTYQNNNNRIESFKLCITSIMKYKKEDTTVIVVDDGSIIKDHIVWTKEIFPMIRIVEKEQNGGIAKCKNTCLRALSELEIDIYFLLDDDIEILQPFEDKYTESLKEVSILSAHAPETGNFSIFYNNTTCITEKLNGFLLCFTKSTFLKCGYFKVLQGKWGYEHCWYTRRIMLFTNTTNYFDVNSNDLYKLIYVDSTFNSIEKDEELNKNSTMMNDYDIYHLCIE